MVGGLVRESVWDMKGPAVKEGHSYFHSVLTGIKWLQNLMCQPSQHYVVFFLFVTSWLPKWTQYQLCCHCWYKSRCVQRNANAVSSLYSLFKLCGWPGGSIGRAGGLCSVGNFFCREQEKGSWPGSLQEGRGKYKHPPPLLLLPHSEMDARNQYFTWIPFRVMGCPCQLFRAIAYGSFGVQPRVGTGGGKRIWTWCISQQYCHRL